MHYLCTAITRVNGGRGVRASNTDTIAATRPRRASRASTRHRSNYSSEEEDDDYEVEVEDDEEEYEEEKIYRGGVISRGGGGGGESSDFDDLTNPATMEALDYVGGSSGELQQLCINNKKKLPARQARNAGRTRFANTLDSSSSGSGQLVSSQSDELVYKNRQRTQRQAANARTSQQTQQQIFSGRPLAVNNISFQPGQATQTIFLAHQQQQQRQGEEHANGATTATMSPNNGLPLGHRISDPTILRQMSLGIRTISNNMQVSLGPFHEESQELPPIAPLCNTGLMNQQPGGSASTSGDGTNNNIDRLSSSERISLSQALSSGTISGLFQPNNASQHLAGGGGSLTMGLMQRQFSRQSSGGIPRLMSDFRQDSIIMPDSLLPAIGGSFNFDADGDLPLGAILNDHHKTQLDPAGVHHHPKAGTTFIDRRLSAGRGELTAGAGAGGGKDKSATQTHQLEPSPMTHALLGVGGKGSRESDMTAVIGAEADVANNNNSNTNTTTPSHLVGQISDLSPLLSELDQGSGGVNYTTPSTNGSIKGEMAVRASRSVSRSGSQGNLSLTRRSTGSGAIPVNTTTSGGMMMVEESVAEAAARKEKRQAAAASLAATATQSDRDTRLAKARQMRQQHDATAAPTTTTLSAKEEYIAAIGGQNTTTTTTSTTTEDDEMIDGPNNHLWRLQSFLFQKSKSGINEDAAREAVAAAATAGLFKHMSIDEPNAVAAVQQSLAVSGSLRRLTEEEEAAVAAAASGDGSGMESAGAGFGSLLMMAGGNNTDLSSGGGQGIEEDDDLVVTGRGGSVTSKQPALGVAASNR